jgi:hypothetical protein
MRVKGPGDGAPPISSPDPIGEADAAARTEAADAVDGVSKVDAGAPVDRAAPVAATSSAKAADPITEVARRLRAGEITAQQALDLIIDDVVERQVGRAVADRRALAAELRALLARQTEIDPYLASKMRRLGNRS